MANVTAVLALLVAVLIAAGCFYDAYQTPFVVPKVEDYLDRFRSGLQATSHHYQRWPPHEGDDASMTFYTTAARFNETCAILRGAVSAYTNLRASIEGPEAVTIRGTPVALGIVRIRRAEPQ